MNVDIDHMREWIGAQENREEVLTASLAERFHATLGLPGMAPSSGEIAPRLIHFCLCQAVPPLDALGSDGHPARGGFLPPVPLPRRMWAGSDLTFPGDLRVGDTVRRRSSVVDLTVKEGRSGTLCFVTVDHAVEGGSGIAVHDRQTIVYRSIEASPSQASAEEAALGEAVVTVEPTPTLLFRYSALTFNGHRIHYDQPYATQVEGYRGLVVHGPLQATLLYHLAARENGGVPPARFTFRSLSTLFDTDLMCLHAGRRSNDELSLWSARPRGPVAMRATAGWS